jgi:hypothetical protein
VLIEINEGLPVSATETTLVAMSNKSNRVRPLVSIEGDFVELTTYGKRVLQENLDR